MDPISATVIVYVSASVVTCVTSFFGDSINEAIHDVISTPIHPKDPMNGKCQIIGTLRSAREMNMIPIPGDRYADDLTDEEWKQVPHMKAIKEYGQKRAGIYNLYWTRHPVLLNALYMKWLHSVPMDSPIHLAGNHIEVFVELHRKYFMTGLHGRLRDRL
jgi:hypothetical protein